jgi:prepilin-type N-terminal cleavage/methylation domain-containing protein
MISLKNHRPKDKVQNQKQGFTLVEVLVGILVMAAFTGTAMQAIVSATAFKVKAEELSEATVWIQEDLELVRYEANKVGENIDACTASDPKDGYAQKLMRKIDSSVTDETEKKSETVKKSAIGQRPYILKRDVKTKDKPDDKPFNVLALNYTVTQQGKTTPIAQIYSEIIPDQFLSCP